MTGLWVGLALLGVVIGVVIGYLLGRRRSVTEQPTEHRDHLTGALDRVALAEALEQIGAAEQGVQLHWLCCVDIDRFSELNRGVGHPAADRMLVTLASVLTETGLGQVFRLSGDEFALLSSERTKLVLDKVEQVRATMAGAPHSATSAAVTVSIGVASWQPSPGDDPLDVLNRAQQALRLAKGTGNRVWYFTDDDAERMEYRDAMEQCLRQALAENTIEFVYQPIVRMSDATVVSVESLSRWRDPVLGVVSPADFVAVAEETGLLEELGWQSLRDGVSLIADLTRQGSSISVGVNVSPLQLRRLDFVDRLTGLLDEFQVPAGRLTIEVTEGVFIDLADNAVATLDRLADLGFNIAIDDFGSGYSSLGYITRLPATAIKIDRSLATNVGQPRTRSILSAVLQVANAHHLKVIVEGIEDRETAATLVDLGASLCQGWLYSPAVPREELLPTIQKLSEHAVRIAPVRH